MKVLFRSLFVLGFSLLCSAEVFAQNGPFVRQPSLSPDGNTVSFSYQGDIWSVPTTGGKARRLTIHEGYDGNPVWSADGKQLAFQSNRFGNNDLFVMDADGSMPKRLTYYSGGDQISGWTPDGDILFTTQRSYNQIEWDPEVYQVPSAGGTPERVLDAFGNMPVMSPNGRFLAFVRGACRISREEYRGPANKDVWIYDTQSKAYSQLTEFDGNDIYPQWGDDNTLYFVSARSGRYNVYKQAIGASGEASGSAEQLTNYRTDGVRFLSVAGNNQTLVFERQTDIFTLPTTGGTASKVNIEVPSDYRFDPMEHRTMTSGVGNYAVSPNGKLALLEIRGELFVTETNKDKKRAVNLTNHAYRDMEPAWLNDTTAVFLSDREGQFDMYLLRSADSDNTNLFKSLKHEIVRITKTKEDENSLVVSPDGKRIAYMRGRGTFIVANISEKGKLSKQKTLSDSWAGPGGITWSPDGKWLAYSMSDLDFNSEIYIQPSDGSGKPVNISMHPKVDFGPVWSRDGSKLGFVSQRNNSDSDVWFVWLKKEDWEKTQRDWDEAEEPKGKKSDDVTVVIDTEDIHERLVQVTSLPGNESNLAISKDGETFFFTTNAPGRQTSGGDRDLYSIKWDGSEQKAVTKGNRNPRGISLSPDGSHLYALGGRGTFSRFSTKSLKQERLSFSGKMTIDFVNEREQIFEEAWRTLRDGFYDPDYHGDSWTDLRKKYKPWALSASTENDFYYMVNLMLGQLNASHMGVFGPNRAQTQREVSGLLGLELRQERDGVRISKVVRDSPADRTNSKLVAGETIVAVNGKNLGRNDNFYQHFTNSPGEQLYLTVKGTNGQNREVVIRPTSSRTINRALYNEWVKEHKALTEKYSNGRLGYIHIQGMNWTSFERFERELTAAGLGKDGIVIDVRFNGGGWTTDYLMAVLNVKQHAYTVPRGAAKNIDKENGKFVNHYPYGERLPLASWVKPSVALCNENSYSNAEIFSHAYKHLGIGTLVGQPTFGAVISTGGQRLIDGSLVRLPFRGWYVKATQENMENGPAVPDILVENSPGGKARGEDEQLQRAVDELLKQIDGGATASNR